MMRYSYRLTQGFGAVGVTVGVTLVSVSPVADPSSRIPLSCSSGYDDSPNCSCSCSPMMALSSVVNGCETFIGPASVFPAEFRNVNMRSKNA